MDRVLVGGLVIGLLFGLRAAKIEPAEILTWSWKRFRSRAIGGLVVGLVGGLVVGLVGGLVVWAELRAGLSYCVVGLLGGLTDVGLLGSQANNSLNVHPSLPMRVSGAQGDLGWSSCWSSCWSSG